MILLNNLHNMKSLSLSDLVLSTPSLLISFRYGWLADATLRYPMRTSKPSCGGRIGIIGSPTPQDNSKTSNAWCYK